MNSSMNSVKALSKSASNCRTFSSIITAGSTAAGEISIVSSVDGEPSLSLASSWSRESLRESRSATSVVEDAFLSKYSWS